MLHRTFKRCSVAFKLVNEWTHVCIVFVHHVQEICSNMWNFDYNLWFKSYQIVEASVTRYLIESGCVRLWKSQHNRWLLIWMHIAHKQTMSQWGFDGRKQKRTVFVSSQKQSWLMTPTVDEGSKIIFHLANIGPKTTQNAKSNVSYSISFWFGRRSCPFAVELVLALMHSLAVDFFSGDGVCVCFRSIRDVHYVFICSRVVQACELWNVIAWAAIENFMGFRAVVTQNRKNKQTWQ